MKELLLFVSFKGKLLRFCAHRKLFDEMYIRARKLIKVLDAIVCAFHEDRNGSVFCFFKLGKPFIWNILLSNF